MHRRLQAGVLARRYRLAGVIRIDRLHDWHARFSKRSVVVLAALLGLCNIAGG
jgi:hypothetical protein